MSKKMLINATHPEENRVAIVENGILTELDIEIAGHEQTKGNIYKATVVRVETGLQAAFVDYGAERLGFLQLSEIHPGLYPKKKDDDGKSRPRLQEILSRGQELLVQIVKEERGTKGAALTTFLSFPGRFMVLMPGSDTRGMSRKIEASDERKQLKEALKGLVVPEDIGYIVRTASLGASAEELRLDLDYLLRLYRSILNQSQRVKAPALIYRESNLVMRTIRDYFSTEMDEVLIDDPKIYEETREFFRQLMPDHLKLVKLHQERRPIFSRYQIEEQIETIYKNKVPLPSGGSIVIDQTEALVAIDVNSGKMSGEQGIEATAYKTNLEAAEEVARQLRLRDLGGLVVIDFIDMAKHSHDRDVERRLKESLKYDKARISVGRISQFGMLEMSRQRIKPALAEASYLTCEHCNGSGRIKSPESLALAFLRRIHAAVAKGKTARIEGRVSLEVASYLLNAKRDELVELERRHQAEIILHGDPAMRAEPGELEVIKREKGETAKVALAEVPLRAAAEEQLIVSRSEEPGDDDAEELEEPGEEEAATADGENGTKKKRRRRRRKKKPAEGETPEGEGSEAVIEEGTAAADEALAEETATEGADEASAAPAKKKRRRGGRKRRGAKEAATDGEAPTEFPSEPLQAEATPTVGDQVAEKPATKRAPRRKAAAKPEESAAVPTTAPQAEAAPGAATEGEEPPAKKPAAKRAPRKKAAAKPEETAAVPTTAPQAEAVAGAAAEGEEPPAKKPAAKRTPRKKAAAKSEEAVPAPALTAPVEATPVEAKPKRAPARRTTKKTATPADDKPAQASEDKPAKKPATRRAPRKKSTETTSEE